MNTSQPLRQIRPLKRLGQNFLTNRDALKTIIEAAELKPNDVVLEIGPGTGVLTLELAKYAKKVIAVEKDARMVEILKKLLEGQNVKNVEIIQGNILKYKIPHTKYKVVANLPYYITSPAIRKFLEAENPPKEMILMVQKEVGQRICAKPPDMTLLAVSVQFYAKPKIISYVSKKSFWPSPKVDSAILQITPQINTDKKLINADNFFKVVKAGFSHPRKQLINNLSTGLSLPRTQVTDWLQKNKILPTARAETLTVENWIKLAESYKMN